MTSGIWWFAALCVLAAIFVLWPMLASRRETASDETGKSGNREQLAVNRAVYQEHLQELEQQYQSGSLGPEQYRKLKQELDDQLEQDSQLPGQASDTEPRVPLKHGRWLLLGAAVLLPLTAVFLYSHWGGLQDWEIDRLIRDKQRLEARQAPPETIRPLAEQLQQKLERRVADRPDNFNNWIMLGRTAYELGDYDRSVDAYRYILERSPNSPQVLSELAQVLFVGSGNRFSTEVQALFDKALSLEPDNIQILSMAGLGAYQSEQYAVAVDYWERMLTQLPPGDERREMLAQALAQAKQGLVSTEGEAPGDTESSPSVEVSVDLGEGVKDQIAGTDTLFIYARAWQGPKMPLAMVRLTADQLPVTVILDKSRAMAPGMDLNQAEQWEIIARISPSGMAQAQPGDWQASVGPVSAAPDQPVELVIQTRIP